MNAHRWVTLLLLSAAAIGATGMLVQHAQTRALRSELALLRADQQALATARAENARLKAAQVTSAELASLRADHAAAERLRVELNMLRDSVRKAETAVEGSKGMRE